jgi:hypothetical protein
MKSFNSHCFSRRWLGVGMALVAAAAAQAQTAVTFQIDMAPISPTVPTTVSVSGIFNGWPSPSTSTNLLINVGGTIWSNTFIITDAPGTVESCKFQYEPGDNWEGDPNRQFEVGSGSTQVLPLTSWNVKDWPAPTNQVAFQVDMSAQVLLGDFTNGQGTITVSGDFEGWNDGLPLTNNPASITTNIYTGTFPVTGFPGGTTINYKFRENGGWESPASTGGNNRQAAITSATQVLPLVFYNDNSVYDLVTSNTLVTFSLYITNGTLDDTGFAFQKGTDQIFVNGDFLGWWGWGINAGPVADQMIEVGTSDVYTNSLVIPKGNSIYLTYKYGLDGFDDENGSGTNHVRLIRSYPPTYTFPQDVWSYTYLPGANTTTNIVEQDFGNLMVTPISGGNIPITWLGRPGVVLQNKSSLSSGVLWTDNNGTDGTQATNWPNGGSSQFFRLKKNQ